MGDLPGTLAWPSGSVKVIFAQGEYVNALFAEVGMNFREAMDLLCLTANEASDELRKAGIQAAPQTIRHFRLDPRKDGHRAPPHGWKAVFGGLARRRAEELLMAADELEEGAVPFKLSVSFRDTHSKG